MNEEFTDRDDMGPTKPDEVISEPIELDEEVAELVQQLADCREAEKQWAGALADALARLNDLQSLRRNLEREIRQLHEARASHDGTVPGETGGRIAVFPKLGDDT